MPEQHLFEYSVIKFVPRVERGEMLNLGVILYCKDQEFLGMKYILDEERVTAFYKDADTDNICLHLRSMDMICKGDPTAFGIAGLEQSFRFRWLAAKRSTIIQTSDIHPGLCDDAGEMLEHLFRVLVL